MVKRLQSLYILCRFILLADSETKMWKFIIVSSDVTLCILRAAFRFQLYEEYSQFVAILLPPQFFFFLQIPLFEMVFCPPLPNLEQQEMYVYVCVCVEPLSQNTVYPNTGSCNLIHIYPAVNLSRSLHHSTAVLSMCCWTHFRHWCWNPRTENH